MIRLFKFVAISEGCSFIILLINMILIKPNNFDLYKKLLFPIGMGHGVLFIAYIILALIVKFKLNWLFKDLALILLASFIPFGTFYIETNFGIKF